MRRQCTREYKIEPIEREIKEQLLKRGLITVAKNGSYYVKRGTVVETWIGISLDEVERAKTNRNTWQENRWPLLERRMTRQDCRQWLNDHGLPIPGRSSCRICPYHNDDYWRDMRDFGNGDWSHVVDFDRSLRDERAGRFSATAKANLFLHRSCVPLSEVDLRTAEEKGQLRLFEDEDNLCDGGYCFV